ncbi:MAG: hypothetical protein JGK17_21915 [Microcoleus sp. PH2017_10_PVI_O_A]|uniref:hypothetical protein n=1 Tax=unclassified Microcoleus TaxID=2642155 RepID=UPI001DB2473E|nr:MULTISPECIES: hypothetical protein [unclassified Microcoleus]TAE78512.1 MAG: hypothetical protein EAZ83_24395 [Oscillatoriales cyanobacterium]MCC3408194.1 hypothetical protein [Microcoleus sp. PH2017_10_PVI_O_A]MCC3462884.1 hypothetical protein [Microcoleus sp. PH2017_11_PCY_U_A]MCC3480739.1 hypothetical protein [Microcoleus sp. PH2017_12_PCY_D_A]MCC3530665.1 hypothetical protein [Microcoleus sp. PH2017_21_RUC_O_A]
MAYWSKITYEKNTYIIDLDTISAFSSELDNKRITFWLPNSSLPIILNPQGNYEAYKQILEYIKKTIDRNSKGSWIKINYDRKDFAIDLSRISSFACEQNGRLISFCLPDSATNIIIMREGNSEDYQKLQEYIKNMTGHSLP